MHVIFRQTKTSSNPMRKSDTSYAVINKQVRGQTIREQEKPAPLFSHIF